MESVSLIMWISGHLIAGAAIWGAIRADIKHMLHTQKTHQEDIKDSRNRIDRLFELYYQQQRSTHN